MTPNDKSYEQTVADYMARPGAADTARAYAILSGLDLPDVVASVWNEAHALYLSLRQGYSVTGPEIRNFDSAWNVWTANPPGPTDPEALVHANRALLFYKKANIAATAQQSEAENRPERFAFATRTLMRYWEIGADVAHLASVIEATRPIAPEGPSEGPIEVKVGTVDELKAHLNAVEASLARISASIKALRTATIP